LTIDSIKLYNAPVIQSGSDEDLDLGVIHLPETPMPWEDKSQKNVYLAGHWLGNPKTTGHMIFYNLDKLSPGDRVTLKERSSGSYEYKVTESFAVEPDALWAVDPVKDHDMVTLQTCNYPGGENRRILRADRI
jgi:sortase A